MKLNDFKSTEKYTGSATKSLLVLPGNKCEDFIERKNALSLIYQVRIAWLLSNPILNIAFF